MVTLHEVLRLARQLPLDEQDQLSETLQVEALAARLVGEYRARQAAGEALSVTDFYQARELPLEVRLACERLLAVNPPSGTDNSPLMNQYARPDDPDLTFEYLEQVIREGSTAWEVGLGDDER